MDDKNVKNMFDLRLTQILAINFPEGRDKLVVHKWLKKFTVTDEKSRNKYLPLFLLGLQQRILIEPFLEPPKTLEPKWDNFAREYTISDAKNFIKEAEFKEFEAPPYQIDVSNDMKEYVAFQEIPKFGCHCYYAYSPHSLDTWQNFNKLNIPKKLIPNLYSVAELKEIEESNIIPRIMEKQRQQLIDKKKLVKSRAVPADEPNVADKTAIALADKMKNVPPHIRKRFEEQAARTKKQKEIAQKTAANIAAKKAQETVKGSRFNSKMPLKKGAPVKKSNLVPPPKVKAPEIIPTTPVVKQIDPELAEAVEKQQEQLTRQWGEQADLKLDRLMKNLKQRQLTLAQHSALKDRFKLISKSSAPPKVPEDSPEHEKTPTRPIQFEIDWDAHEPGGRLEFLQEHEMNDNMLAEAVITVIEENQEDHLRMEEFLAQNHEIPTVAREAIIAATPEARLEKLKQSIKSRLVERTYIDDRNAKIQAIDAEKQKKIDEANAKLKEKLAKVPKKSEPNFVSPPMASDLLKDVETLKDRPFRLYTPALERFDDYIGWQRPDRMENELAKINRYYEISQQEQDDLDRLQEIDDGPIDLDQVDLGEFGEDLVNKVQKTIEILNESSDILESVFLEFPDDEKVRQIAVFLNEKNEKSAEKLQKMTTDFINEVWSLSNYNLKRKSVLTRIEVPKVLEQTFYKPLQVVPRSDHLEKNVDPLLDDGEIQRSPVKRNQQRLQKDMQATSHRKFQELRRLVDNESIVPEPATATEGLHDHSWMKLNQSLNESSKEFSRMIPERSVNESDYIDFDVFERRLKILKERNQLTPNTTPKSKHPLTLTPALSSARKRIRRIIQQYVDKIDSGEVSISDMKHIESIKILTERYLNLAKSSERKNKMKNDLASKRFSEKKKESRTQKIDKKPCCDELVQRKRNVDIIRSGLSVKPNTDYVFGGYVCELERDFPGLLATLKANWGYAPNQLDPTTDDQLAKDILDLQRRHSLTAIQEILKTSKRYSPEIKRYQPRMHEEGVLLRDASSSDSERNHNLHNYNG